MPLCLDRFGMSTCELPTGHIDVYMRDSGLEVDPMDKTKEPRTIRTTLYIPPELWKQVKIEAIKRDCDATDITVWALEAWLKSKGGKS